MRLSIPHLDDVSALPAERPAESRSGPRPVGPGRDSDGLGPSSRAELLAGAAAILAVSLAFRIVELDTLPGELYGDIAIIYEYVDGILRGQFPTGFVLSNGPLYGYVISPLVGVLGRQGYLPYKLASVLVSLLGLGCTYLFVRQVAGTPTALLSSFFLACSSWYVVFSRLGNSQILIPVLAALSYYLLASAVRRDSSVALVGGLFVASLGLYVMPQSFVLPVSYLASAALLVTRRRLALLCGLAILFALPFGLLLGTQFDLFFAQSGYIGSKIEASPGAAETFGLNVWRSLLAFHVQGDLTFRSNPPGLPHLDPLSGIALVVGLLSLLRGPTAVGIPMLLIPLAILQLPANLVTTEVQPTPSASRTVAILPFLALAIGTGLRVSSERIRPAPVRRLALGTVLAASLAINWGRYFDSYAAGLPDGNTPFGKLIARRIDELPPDTRVLLYSCCWGAWSQPEIRGILYVLNQPREIDLLERGTFTCDLLADRPRPVYVVWDPRDAGAATTPATCGAAEVETHRSVHGAIVFTGYRLRSEAEQVWP